MSHAMKVRLAVFSAALLLVTVAGWYLYGQQRVASEHDRIVRELVDKGQYRQAVDELEPLMDEAGFTIREEMERTLALCYAGIGGDPTVSLAEAARWYRKAEALDPDVLDEQQRREMRAGEGQPAPRDG